MPFEKSQNWQELNFPHDLGEDGKPMLESSEIENLDLLSSVLVVDHVVNSQRVKFIPV